MSKAKKPAPKRKPSARKAVKPPKVTVTKVTVTLDPLLQEGIALFNHRQFFECHEVLEQRWKATHDHSKDFYKGLIQAAVAFHHWSKGNLAGALTLAKSASKYLRRYEPSHAGVDVSGFLAQFSEMFQWLRHHHQRYDANLVPLLHHQP